MKTCPFCVEDIQPEAIKCKHCQSDLTSHREKEKQEAELKNSRSTPPLKQLGVVALVLFSPILILYWYISLPLVVLIAIWTRKTWSQKQKIITTIVCAVITLIFFGISAYQNRAPVLTITSPSNNEPIAASQITITGFVKPSSSTLAINNAAVVLSADGSFSYDGYLQDEQTTFSFRAKHADKYENKSLVYERAFTEEELAKRAQVAAEQVAREQAAIDEQKAKKEAERQAWEASKAGQICIQHPEWEKYDCERLADNKFWVGMSIDMLKYRRGLPNAANPSNYGSGTQWQWCWYDYTPSCFYDENNDGLIDSYN